MSILETYTVSDYVNLDRLGTDMSSHITNLAGFHLHNGSLEVVADSFIDEAAVDALIADIDNQIVNDQTILKKGSFLAKTKSLNARAITQAEKDQVVADLATLEGEVDTAAATSGSDQDKIDAIRAVEDNR